MNVFLPCSAVLVLLYFALAVNVSLSRGRFKVGVGVGRDPDGPLSKAVRAHGNAAEYVPLFVALFLYFLLSGTGGWVELVAVAVTLSRILHAFGMLMTRSFDGPPHPLRSISALGTYLGGLTLGIALLLHVTMQSV